MHPSFYGSDIQVRAGDTRLMRLVKQLGVLQNLPLADPVNNPARHDTYRITLYKLCRAWDLFIITFTPVVPGGGDRFVLETGDTLVTESGDQIVPEV